MDPTQILTMSRPIIDEPLNLKNFFDDELEDNEMFESPLIGDNQQKLITEGARYMPKDSFIPE